MTSKLSDHLQQRIDAVNAEFAAVVAERAELRQARDDGTITEAQFYKRGTEHRVRVNKLTMRADELKSEIAELTGAKADEDARVMREKRAVMAVTGSGPAGHNRMSDQELRAALESPEHKAKVAAKAADDNVTRRAANGMPVTDQAGRVVVVSEEPIYRKDEALNGQSSFFRDLYNVTRGDWAAAERLNRNNQAMDMPGREARALSTTAGAGGQFAPPLWLVEEFIRLARPARVTADLLHHEVLPDMVSSINLPSVATGTTTAVQSTQNTALSQTDATTSAASSGIITIGGKQVSSLQLLRQSPIPIDQMILGDLAADYAKQLDQQVIFGTNTSGQLKGLTSWGTSVTWTSASPVVAGTTPANSFQAQITKVAAAIANTRFAPATSVVMSPERWGWIAEAVDSQGRPLVPPTGGGSTLNSFGSANSPLAQGEAGYFAGLPVYVDPALTVASGNETVLILREDDTWLYESEITMDTVTAPYSDSLGVLFRCFGFTAMVARYAASIQAMSGTGTLKVTLG